MTDERTPFNYTVSPLPEVRIEARKRHPEMFEHARYKPIARQAHLDTFFLGHPAKGVWKLVYDSSEKKKPDERTPSQQYKRKLEEYHGFPTRPTEPIDGPGFMLDVPAVRESEEWKYRQYRTRPIFITPAAYELTRPEFENFLVDRLYWRARDLCGTPIMPWRDTQVNVAGGHRVADTHRIPRDLLQHLDEKTYRYLSDTSVLLRQVRGGMARDIIDTPTMHRATEELFRKALFLAQTRAETPYGQRLIERALREVYGREHRP